MAEPIAPAALMAACAPIADRAATLRASAIREIFDAAQRVPGALRLEVGEPDFASPPWVVEAADRAARDGATHYTPNTGIAPLRDALADKVRRVNGWEATAAQCIVTAGGVQALHLASPPCSTPATRCCCPIRCGPTSP
ncbi:MAG: aminotransferase class I/II-fold pyridoxal phosphate-dependent enzyme [Acidimicrobiales bacterium]